MSKSYTNPKHVMVLLSLFAVQPAYAADGDIDGICLKNDLSTSAKSECFSSQENILSNQLQVLYKQITDGNEIETIQNDFIKSQEDFQNYLDSECKLEADVVAGGSASAFIYPRCKYNLLSKRISVLNDIKKSADEGLYVSSNDSQGK